MKKTLIVVDMQNDFIDGPLGSEDAVAIVNNVKKKINEYYKAGHEIIFTRDTHGEDYLNTSEGTYLPVVHCIKDTHGWQIIDGLEVPGCKYIDKPNFGYTDWLNMNLEEVEIIGVCTDICVVSNALIIKALYPEIQITVDAECCAGVSTETHYAALTTMKCCQINIINY